MVTMMTVYWLWDDDHHAIINDNDDGDDVSLLIFAVIKVLHCNVTWILDLTPLLRLFD